MAESFKIAAAIFANCCREVTANRFDGTRNEKMHASSDGRKHEAIRPTGFTGLPMPFTSESVGFSALRWKRYGPGPSLRCWTRIVCNTSCIAFFQRASNGEVSPVAFQ